MKTKVETPKTKTEAEMEPQTRALFVYGTLMDPALLSNIISSSFTFAPGKGSRDQESEQTATYLRDQRMHKATLFNYERRCVRWRSFPAIVACPGRSVEGFLIEGVTDSEAELLDRYEGGMYDSVPVKVAMGWELGGERKDGEGEWRSALVYVWAMELDRLIDTKEKVWRMGRSYR